MKLQQRPGKQELIDRNILYQASEDERKMERSIIGAKLIRRLSLRPSQEELQDRNILKSKKKRHSVRIIKRHLLVSELDNDSIRNDMEEKKRYLLRKLSFRPTVDELRNRKVSKTNIGPEAPLDPILSPRMTYDLAISDNQVQ